MKNYLLTDFHTERWGGIDLDSVETQLEELKNRISIDGVLFGELGTPSNLDIHLKNVSHSIKNLIYSEGKIYGDIKFLDNEKGAFAKELIENKTHRFGIRSVGTNREGVENINRIFTWDVIKK